MTQDQWFEGEDAFDEVQAQFLDALVDRAVAGWQARPGDIELALPDYERYGYLLGDDASARGKLLVYCDVVDPSRNVALLTVGAYLDGEHVRGDAIHNQLFTLPGSPTPLALQATGTPQRLGALTADWFGTILNRPIQYQEWLRNGTWAACQWIFSDTNRPLANGGDPGLLRTLPDRVVQVRTRNLSPQPARPS